MPQQLSLPRVVVAGLAGDSGKTIVALGLLLSAAARGLSVRGFKKGPDYIDAAWLAWASRMPARNLDSFLMGFDACRASFARHAPPGGLSVVEGNRGLFDGSDSAGTHSTAELAKTLRAPVVLVVNTTKVTRTAAALVLGCRRLDPDLDIAGVILNQVGGERHERVVRESIESVCGLPVLGALPRLPGGHMLPSRHLGLVTPFEHPGTEILRNDLRRLLEGHLDWEPIIEISRRAPAMEPPAPRHAAAAKSSGALKVGYLHDSAFNFYYPENLEALEGAGATLLPMSSLHCGEIPDDLSALYIGGGFPETHGTEISANRSFLRSLREAAEGGLPIYAECGGLMLLSQAIAWKGSTYPMAGVLPVEVEMCPTPQGHGYSELVVDRANPYFPVGFRFRGHEFHYSRVRPAGAPPPTACEVKRGTGCYAGRDGILVGGTWAGYTHVHALATPEWASGFLEAAARWRDRPTRM